MDGFTLGLVVGVLSVAAVAGVVVHALTDGVPQVGLPVLPHQVEVGTLFVNTSKGTYVGALVYGPTALAGALLEQDAELYRVAERTLAPNATRDLLCSQTGGCSNGTVDGVELLGQDVLAVTSALVNDTHAGVLENVTVRMVRPATGGTLLLSLAKVTLPSFSAPSLDGPPTELNATVLANASARAEALVADLREACRQAAAETRQDAGACDARYRAFSLFAGWDASWWAFCQLQNEPVSVLGPVALTQTEGLVPSAPLRSDLDVCHDPPESLASIPDLGVAFLPNWALYLVGLAILVSIFLQETAEYAWGNSFIPLPPLALLLGVVLLWRLNDGKPLDVSDTCLWYGGLFFLWFLGYRLLDWTGVQFFSSLSAITAVGAAVAVLYVRLATGLLSDVDGLVQTLARNEAPALAADAARDALLMAGVVATGSLLVWLGASVSAWAEARKVVREEGGVKAILDKTEAELRAFVAKYDPQSPERRSPSLSRYGYASLVTHLYRAARKRPGNAWIKESFLFVDVHPKDVPLAKPKAPPRIVAWATDGRPRPHAGIVQERHTPEERKRVLDWLWEQHRRSSRRARRVADLLD